MEDLPPIPLVRRSYPPHRRDTGRRRGIATFIIAFTMMLMLVAGAVLVSAATVGGAAAASFYHTFTEDLPPIGEIASRDTFKTTRILDRNGDLLYEIIDESGGKRTPVRLADLPPVIIDAVLAAEDASFYDNPGVDAKGIIRAAVQDVRAGSIVSGASTITQQLVRGVLLDPEERTSSTLDRKLKEAFLAMEVSAHYSKDQILEW